MTKLNRRAALLLLDIHNGTDRVFYMTDRPCGWSELERKGLARHHLTDPTRAVLTHEGTLRAEQITSDTH